MTQWIRFEHSNQIGFGQLDAGTINVYTGDLFNNPQPTGQSLSASDVTVLVPVQASKMIALWNNFGMLGEKLSLDTPTDPLYFMKSTTSFIATRQDIVRPRNYTGKVIFEGELGIVIGRECKGVSAHNAADYIFGYTCVNDVTAVELLKKDASFDQWTRSKSFDTFGVVGPVVATDLDPMTLTVRAVLNDSERQNYPVTDMHFPPYELVSRLSEDVTLLPGDIIACGTNVGVGSMKPDSTINISIEGIGTLSNRFVE